MTRILAFKKSPCFFFFNKQNFVSKSGKVIFFRVERIVSLSVSAKKTIDQAQKQNGDLWWKKKSTTTKKLYLFCTHTHFIPDLKKTAIAARKMPKKEENYPHKISDNSPRWQQTERRLFFSNSATIRLIWKTKTLYVQHSWWCTGNLVIHYYSSDPFSRPPYIHEIRKKKEMLVKKKFLFFPFYSVFFWSHFENGLKKERLSFVVCFLCNSNKDT